MTGRLTRMGRGYLRFLNLSCSFDVVEGETGTVTGSMRLRFEAVPELKAYRFIL